MVQLVVSAQGTSLYFMLMCVTTVCHSVCVLFPVASAKTAEYLKLVKFVAVYDCFIRGYSPMHKHCTVV